MAILGIEPHVKKVVEILKANISSALTTVAARYTSTDAVTLVVPSDTDWHIAEREVDKWPAVFVLGHNTSHGAQTGFAEYQSQDEGGGHFLSVIWVDRDDDPVRLRKKIYRSAAAVAQIMANNFDLGATCIVAKVTEENYSPAFPMGSGGRNVFEQAFEASITVQTEEAI